MFSHVVYMYVFALTSHLPTTHADLVLVEENTKYSDIFSVVSGFLKHLQKHDVREFVPEREWKKVQLY